MSRFFSLRIFSIGFALTYAWAVIQNVPAFRYYPLINKFTLTDLADKTIGPAMSWYGWIAYAIAGGVVAAIVIALALPRRLIDKLPAAVYWLAPAVMLWACWVREQDWFLK